MNATDKLVIVMVGLPARGKSYITKKISNYLNWLNIENKVFNVGNKRRVVCDDKHDASFFDPHCEANVKIRDLLAMKTLDEVLEWISGEGQVAIFDATNSTVVRRQMVVNHINERASSLGIENYNVLFLESICNDAELIEQNILLKLNGPDYRDNKDKMASLRDFKQRLLNYESVYETVSQDEIVHSNVSYLKIINVLTITTFNIQGFLPVILNNFLNNFNLTQKKIWLSLSHFEYHEIAELVDSKNLTIFSSSPHAQRKIPLNCTLDQVHDLILDIEASEGDLLVQTADELLINGILKYFLILDDCHPDLTSHLVCIHPHHYSVGLQKFNVLEIPEMTRSNSAMSSTTSCIYTPKDVDELDLTAFNYKNLNLSDLQAKLAQLPHHE